MARSTVEDLLVAAAILIEKPDADRFKVFFGLTLPIALNVYLKLTQCTEALSVTKVQYLYTLYYLRRYPTFTEMASLFHKDEKTIRCHINQVLRILDKVLPEVSLGPTFTKYKII
jgi:hypothetical protein